MRLKGYVYLWISLTVFLSYEYFALNFRTVPSSIEYFANIFEENWNLAPQAGRSLSVTLGWIGFALICLTNIYILRKRWGSSKNTGQLSGWLNFHIFCGLIGPTLVIFHTNFKVGGLVAISFWSMIIVAVSGMIGRYLFVQVARAKTELEEEIAEKEKLIPRKAPQLTPQAFEDAKTRVLTLAGASSASVKGFTSRSAITSSLVGDLRINFGLSGSVRGLSRDAQKDLKGYSLAKRRLAYYDFFKLMLGYWHSFHLPFAYFMYIVAVIHIVSALIFGVDK